MRKIYVYKNDKCCPVIEFLNKADDKIKDKFYFCLNYLSKDNNRFAMPYVKHFSCGKFSRLYEVRIMALSKMVRVIFYEHNDDIILIYPFYKKNLKDTKTALAAAIKILDSMAVHKRCVISN